MKTLIIGDGWIGNRLADTLGEDAHVSGKRLESLEEEDLAMFDVVINAAAKTNIDWCEEHKADALDVNAMHARRVALFCKVLGIRYVYISSACIFQSATPDDIVFEDDKPNPQCFYAVTKWVGEELVREANPASLIVRIRLPISSVPHPRNTIGKILKYKELVNSEESVTVIEDMIPVLEFLIQQKAEGVFHLVNAGTITMPEIVSYFHQDFSVIDKHVLRARTREAGKADRVSTVVGSKKIPLLPDIHERIGDIVRVYKSLSV
jgi:dTDP-4-dehydrorhamnose reductase